MEIKNILLILTILTLSFSCNSRNEKERIESVIRMSDDYKNARTSFESSEFEKAFKLYNKILNNHPQQDWLRLEKGDMYRETKEYTKALSCYNSIVSPEELNIGARQIDLRIGGIYEKINKIDSAIYYYNKILQSSSKSEIDQYIGYDSDRVSALTRLGEIAFKNSKYEDAIDYFSQVIEIERIPKAQYIRANAYYLIGNPDLALKDYEESIDMIRKIYIDKHPNLKNILCDTCDTFLGKEEYMAVLVEWRDFEEKIREKKQIDSLITSQKEYKTMIDSIPKWNNEIELLKHKNDFESIQRFNSLKDSVSKYLDTIITLNINY